VVAPLVHHEEPVRAASGQPFGGADVARERLLAEDRDRTVEQAIDHLGMGDGRRDHDRRRDLG
jgi:hypothetical protein